MREVLSRRVSRRRPVAAGLSLALFTVLFSGTTGLSAAAADDGGVGAARAAASKAAREYSDAQTQAGLIEQKITDIEGRQRDSQAQIDQLTAAVKRVFIEQYAHAGPSDPSLTGFTDLNRQLRMTTMLEIIGQNSSDALGQYRSVKADRDRRAGDLASLKAQQAALVALLAQRQQKVETELTRLEELQQQRLDAAEKARQAELRQRAIDAAKQPATGGTKSVSRPPVIIGSGSWICPVQGPVSFTDDFGEPRAQGRHKGNDMFAPRGTPVVAVVSGTVSLRSVSIGGRSFFLHGDDGNTYFGTHLNGYEGSDRRVSAGEVIAYVGDDGDAKGTGTHLHFEIRPGGGPAIDPFPTISRYC